MRTKDVIKIALKSTLDMVPMYLNDVTDQELSFRPVPGANNIAWQLAHLVTAEKFLLDGELRGVQYPDIPVAIASLGAERTGKADPPDGYPSKAQFLDALNKMRAATIAAVDQLTDADFDKPVTNVMAKMAPTLGALLILTANHTLMHAGQFTVTRRALNKPVVF